MGLLLLVLLLFCEKGGGGGGGGLEREKINIKPPLFSPDVLQNVCVCAYTDTYFFARIFTSGIL